jgi:hypothetical protein
MGEFSVCRIWPPRYLNGSGRTPRFTLAVIANPRENTIPTAPQKRSEIPHRH